MVHRKILLVDDQFAVTFTLERVLTKQGGYKVLSVNDPLSAIQAALEFQPNLIVMDIVMPHMDGSDLAVQMRRHPQLTRIPVIFFSGSLSTDEAGTYRRQGTGPVILSKAAGIKELMCTIERVLAGTVHDGVPVAGEGYYIRPVVKSALMGNALYPAAEVSAKSA